jgi:PAS domain S-box-containing protein
MKIRTILIILASLSFISMSSGGYLYYSSLKESGLKEAYREAGSRTKVIADHIASNLSEYQKSVKALANLKELKNLLISKDEINLEEANQILDHFKNALDVSICYIMDHTGNTIASSNRNSPDSFVGKNYSFRPYFLQAIQGNPAIYMALGITSKKRGVYFSHPIYGELDKTPIGVVVIKNSTEEIEKEIDQEFKGIMLFTDPHGVIFVTNTKDWLYHVIWKVSSEEITAIAKTRQFGTGPWSWIGLERIDGNNVIDQSGIKYHIHQAKIQNYPDWNVIYLHDTRSILKNISDPLFKTSGLIILVLCLLTGVAVFFLYREASDDIVQRKRAEDALRESEEHYKNFFDNALVGLFRSRLSDGMFVEINSKAAEQLDLPVEEIVGKIRSSDLYRNPDQRRELISRLKQDGEVQGFETDLTHPDGRDVTFSISVKAYPDKDYMEGAVIDITDRKQAEKALLSEKLLSEEYINSLPGLFYIFDDQRFIRWNSEWNRITGYSDEELASKYGTDFFEGEDRTLVGEEMLKVFREGTSEVEAELVTKDGQRIPYYFTGLRKKLDGKDHLIGLGIDITERKNMEDEKAIVEAQLHQVQKMESIGTLAGGIAHDFNNVLYSIIGYTELTMDDIPEGSLAQKNLKEVFKGAMRAKDMVQQILAFSRKADTEKKPIKVQSVVKEALKLLRNSIPSTIELRQNIDANCGPIIADPTQIHQVVMNLATNAYQAMREKGGVLELTLMGEEISSDDSESYLNLNPGTYLKLTVRDTGHGMDNVVIEKIFDPYFSTKGPGEGTGMGLAVVHGIVKDHGGDIEVYSKLGEGTTFSIYLPLVETKPIEPKAISLEPVPTGTERILFVDDEETIVLMTQQTLERLGYQVTPRTSGVEALEAFRTQPDNFDLVITDFTMPNMTGIELAPKLLEIRSDIPIIICTGFSEIIDKNRAQAIGIREYVMKPIAKEEVARTIRKVLDEGKEK